MTPEELRAKRKKESEDFQAQYGAEGPEGVAPPEEGVDDSVDQLVPSPQDELAKNGWLMGELPSGPATIEKSAAQAADKGIANLVRIGKGQVSQEQLAQAGKELASGSQSTILRDVKTGERLMDVGDTSALGKALKLQGKEQVARAEATAPTAKYQNMFKEIGRQGP